MPYDANVYNVMLASPSDVSCERDAVRDSLMKWNYANSFTTKILLMPLCWDTHSFPLAGDRPQSILNEQVVKNSDFMIAVFGNRLGTPTGGFESGTAEEVEEHIKHGKSVLIYHSSEIKGNFNDIDPVQLGRLKQYLDDWKEKALVDSYKDASDLKVKVSHHISLYVNKFILNKAHNNTNITSLGVDIIRGDESVDSPTLSGLAQEILLAAVSGQHGYLFTTEELGGIFGVHTDGYEKTVNTGRERAAIEQALELLVKKGYLIIDSSARDSTGYRVTKAGYDLLS
jgi:hypothetical protein